MNSMAQAAVVIMLAVALDRFLPEPHHSIHPVVWMGRAVKALEHLAPHRPTPRLVYGGAITLVVAGGSGLATWWVMSTLQSLGTIAYLAGGSLLLRTAFTVRGLSEAAGKIEQSLVDGSPEQTRSDLRSLVSRPFADLTPPLVAAAAVESVAENTTDSFIGPWLSFALFGIPGAVAYRALNTLDSMIGYRGPYEHLGKASARLDDIVNLIPSRLSALLLLVSGVLAGLPADRGRTIMLRDHRLTASPNAGWTMSAMAGLLGTRLEKQGHYCLGRDLRQPAPSDIGRAVGIAEQAAALALVIILGILMARLGFQS